MEIRETKVDRYTIYDNSLVIETQADTETEVGFVDHWRTAVGDMVYCIVGDLPPAVKCEMARIAESRGWLCFYNLGRYEDAVREYEKARDGDDNGDQ